MEAQSKEGIIIVVVLNAVATADASDVANSFMEMGSGQQKLAICDASIWDTTQFGAPPTVRGLRCKRSEREVHLSAFADIAAAAAAIQIQSSNCRLIVCAPLSCGSLACCNNNMGENFSLAFCKESKVKKMNGFAIHLKGERYRELVSPVARWFCLDWCLYRATQAPYSQNRLQFCHHLVPFTMRLFQQYVNRRNGS